MSLLRVNNLSVTIQSIDGPLSVVQGLDVAIEKGESWGIVGESGCGKTITALALMSLLPERSQVSGQIELEGTDLLSMNQRQLSRIRGNRIGMIFQEPMTALNPVRTIGSQLTECLKLHLDLDKSSMRERVSELMNSVGMPIERFPLNLFPHQLSGGQRQRIMTAMAIACEPQLLIADEPTTALDVTVQEQILQLIRHLATSSGMALIMISHDLGVIAQTTEHVMVMYAGRLMEMGKTREVFKRMTHPYTRGLFLAIPKPGSSLTEGRKRLYSIPGHVPDPHDLPTGCVFSTRCKFVTDRCRTSRPDREEIAPGHFVWCFHPVSGKEEVS